MAVVPKEPLDWMTLLQLQMDEIFDYISGLEGREAGGECDFLPPIDIFESADTYTVEIELPGIERDDLSLRLCCNMLIVEGVKREEGRERGTSYICLERQFGRFRRAVEIPPTVDVAEVKARFVKGVLWVVFPRLSDKNKILRDIPIEQGDDDGK